MAKSKKRYTVKLGSMDFPKARRPGNGCTPPFEATFSVGKKSYKRYQRAIALKDTPFAVSPQHLRDSLLASKNAYPVGANALVYGNKEGLITQESDYTKGGRLIETRIFEKPSDAYDAVSVIFEKTKFIHKGDAKSINYKLRPNGRSVTCSIDAPANKAFPLQHNVYTFEKNEKGLHVTHAMSMNGCVQPASDEALRLINENMTMLEAAGGISLASVAQEAEKIIDEYPSYKRGSIPIPGK